MEPNPVIPLEHAGRRVDPWMDFGDCPTFARAYEAIDHGKLQVIRCAVQMKMVPSVKGDAMAPMLLCLFEDLDSYKDALGAKRHRVVAMLARAILEGCINVMRLMLGDEEESKRAMAHWEQKSFRNLHRQSDMAGHRMEFINGAAHHTPVKESTLEALKLFTRANNSEKREWGSELLDVRVAYIVERLDFALATDVHMAWLGVYRHASDIIHATHAGAMISLGGRYDSDGKGAEGMFERTNRVSVMTMSVVQILAACVVVLAKELGKARVAEECRAKHSDYLAQCLALLEAEDRGRCRESVPGSTVYPAAKRPQQDEPG